MRPTQDIQQQVSTKLQKKNTQLTTSKMERNYINIQLKLQAT